MNILMLNYEFPPIGGGAATANFYLLNEFAKIRNIRIDLVTSSGANKFEKVMFSDNIFLYKLNVKKRNPNYQTFKETLHWSISTLFFLRHLINKERYAMFHAWFGWPCGFFGYLYRNRIPYIISLRGTDVPGFNQRFNMLDKIIFNHYSRVVWSRAHTVSANSKGLRQLALKTWRGKINLIPNGIDTKEFYPRDKEDNNLVFLTVSRLIPRKGLNYLIQSMRYIVPKYQNVELKIIGDGPEMKSLKRLATQHGVNKYISFLGYVRHDRLAQIYRTSHIFILPSLNEGMSNSILEAMASGLPIIATNTGGAHELMCNNGILIKKRSSKAISNAVLTLIEKKEMRLKYAKNSRKIAEKMSWSKIAEKYFNIYRMTGGAPDGS